MSVDVSVVIPTYNKRDFLALTLASFSHQTHPPDNYEIIVVDDGSGDGTQELIEAITLPCSLKYYKQENKGQATARNLGIMKADGEIIIFNDADVIPAPDFIESHVKCHPKNNAVVIGSKYDILSIWQKGLKPKYLEKLLEISKGHKDVQDKIELTQKLDRVQFILPNEIREDFKKVKKYVLRKAHHNWDRVYEIYSENLAGCLIPWLLFVTANASVQAKHLREVGMFDESFRGWGLEDIELGYRLHRHGLKFRYAEDAANYHQLHPTNRARWQEHARNYRLFCQQHPCLEVYLHWRFAVGILDVEDYNDIVIQYRKLCSAGYKEITMDYLGLAKRLAEQYGQNESFMSGDRRLSEYLRL